MTRPLDSLTEALLAAPPGPARRPRCAGGGRHVAVDRHPGGQARAAERSESVELGLRVLSGGGRPASRPRTFGGDDHRAGRARRRHGPRGARRPTAGLADPDQIAATGTWRRWNWPTTRPNPRPRRWKRMPAAPSRRACRGGITRSRPRRAMAAAPCTSRNRTASRAAMRAPRARSRPWPSPAREQDGAGLGRRKPHLPGRPARTGRSGRLAAERALQRLGARKPRTGAYPVLYDERVAASLIGHLLSATMAAPSPAAQAGRATCWASRCCPPRVGDRGPAPPPHRRLASLRRRGLGPAAADRRKRHPDRLDARPRHRPQAGHAEHGRLARHLAPPSPGTSNIDLTPGTASRDDLLAAWARGCSSPR